MKTKNLSGISCLRPYAEKIMVTLEKKWLKDKNKTEHQLKKIQDVIPLAFECTKSKPSVHDFMNLLYSLQLIGYASKSTTIIAGYVEKVSGFIKKAIQQLKPLVVDRFKVGGNAHTRLNRLFDFLYWEPYNTFYMYKIFMLIRKDEKSIRRVKEHLLLYSGIKDVTESLQGLKR